MREERDETRERRRERVRREKRREREKREREGGREMREEDEGGELKGGEERPGRLTQILAVGSLVALDVEEGVTVVYQRGAIWAEGHVLGLAVPGDQKAVGDGGPSRGAGGPLEAV